MSLYSGSSRRYAPLAMLLSPLAATLVVQVADGVGPSISVAAPAAAPLPIAVPSVVASRTNPQVIAWIQNQREQIAGLASPMVSAPAPVVIEPDAPAPVVVQPENSPQLDIPHLRLTGLLTSERTRWAAINHNLYREGDTIEGGWRLRTIDGTARRVLVEHTSGATIELFAD